MSIQACNSIDALVINELGQIELTHTSCGVEQVITTWFESEWDGNHLVLGDYHIWVDATGALRINDGAPTTDLDGVVVGDQTAGNP